MGVSLLQYLHAISRGLIGREHEGHLFPAVCCCRGGRTEITIVRSGKIKQSRNQKKKLRFFLDAMIAPITPAIH
jgi:hypothetical protein